MPEHYGIDVNVIGGTVSFTNTKTAKVDFKNQQGESVTFTFEPRIQLTLLNASTQVPYKVKATKVGNLFTGFVLGFQNQVTIDVDWQALKRTD